MSSPASEGAEATERRATAAATAQSLEQGNDLASGAGGNRSGGGWELATLVVVWGALAAKLAPAWSASVEQAHGWAVPVLAGYFWWERVRVESCDGKPAAPGAAWAGAIAVAGGALVLALALTVLEANPLWPLAQWTGYGAAVVISGAMLVRTRGTQAARRFWFPLFFVSTALAWPTAATVRLQSLLVGANTDLAAAVVSAAGFPAVVSGNVIEVARGFVGVDEACSGVRSLQAAWMAGWFFGELLRLGAIRRVGLLAGALAAAVAGNLIRTTTLTWMAAARSPATGARWHDVVGDAEMIAVLAAVAALAWALGRGARKQRTQPAISKARPAPAHGHRAVRAEVFCRATLVAAVLAALLPNVWYRSREARRDVARVQWALQSPPAGWRAVELPEAMRKFLRATSSGGLESGEPAAGGAATALLVRWDGDVANAVFAEQHGPTVCLSAAGVGLVVASEPATVTVADVPIEFTVGRFTADGRTQHVLFCQWDAWLARARAPTHETLVDVNGWRWARVRDGRRRGDAAYLVFVVPLAGEVEARAWLAEWAPRLLKRA